MSQVGVDIAALLLRLILGATMFAHGWGHAFRGGRLAGTGRWFESIGLRPGRIHATLATVTELCAGALLVLGLATPLAAAGVIAAMTVALVTNHRRNGFFIFNPGEGYEYVLNLIVAAAALGALGPGQISLDAIIGSQTSGVSALAMTLAAGLGGAVLLLVLCWRPNKQ